ncbi:MAG TPA: hypothetical protein VFJ84_01560 [Candidatus Saccharimonadales bacterium]|nr:hypothetical protein [Candidatus Saccharimonadales bacterium]
MSAVAATLKPGVIAGDPPLLVIGHAPTVAPPEPNGLELLKRRLADALGVGAEHFQDLPADHESFRVDRLPLLALPLTFEHLTAPDAVRRCHEAITKIEHRVFGWGRSALPASQAKMIH